MEKGQIIFLNGVTSAGKTSVAKALQDRDEPLLFALSDDLFEELLSDRYMEYSGPHYWERLREVVDLEYRTARLFSDLGRHVLIDGMLLEHPAFRPHLQRVLDLFAGYPFHIVNLVCPPEICRRRNLQRGDRDEFQSREQLDMMAGDIPAALTLDTSVLSPEACAREILARFFPRHV